MIAFDVQAAFQGIMVALGVAALLGLGKFVLTVTRLEEWRGQMDEWRKEHDALHENGAKKGNHKR